MGRDDATVPWSGLSDAEWCVPLCVYAGQVMSKAQGNLYPSRVSLVWSFACLAQASSCQNQC